MGDSGVKKLLLVLLLLLPATVVVVCWFAGVVFLCDADHLYGWSLSKTSVQQRVVDFHQLFSLPFNPQ
jgi:hypothetical protein